MVCMLVSFLSSISKNFNATKYAKTKYYDLRKGLGIFYSSQYILHEFRSEKWAKQNKHDSEPATVACYANF